MSGAPISSHYDRLAEAFQEVLLGLEADLETGSHLSNNHAYTEFHERYKYLSAALAYLHEVIESL
jgi:hypothetical protein